jgi:drug/metabolite transporter (DMT)-like permease
VIDLQWILPALASPIVYAAVTLGDKRIISTLGLALGSFYLYVGFTQLTIAGIILIMLGWPGASFSALANSFGGGFLWGTGLMLMFYVLRREEVSRVTPVWQSSPVFVSIFALVFLHESIAWHGWLAVLLVVSGAIAVSVDLNRGGLAAFSARPTFFMLLGGAAIIGVAQLLLKVASEDLGVWHNMAFRGIGLCTSIALPWLRPPYTVGLVMWLRNPKNAVSIILTESVGPFTGNLLLLSAIAVGPISLVSALLGTRPIWVLAGTLLLGFTAKHFISEHITGRDLVLKTVATSAVVAGIVIIAVG